MIATELGDETMRYSQEFGPFRVLHELAHGGISMIHRAKFTGHKDCPDVVIKRLKDPYNQDSDFVQMLADEAELMNQMSHSNIVKVHEFGQVGGQYFLATEYVDGVNLRQILRRLQRQNASMKCSVALFLLREALVLCTMHINSTELSSSRFHTVERHDWFDEAS